jgi:hypothetical protein
MRWLQRRHNERRRLRPAPRSFFGGGNFTADYADYGITQMERSPAPEPLKHKGCAQPGPKISQSVKSNNLRNPQQKCLEEVIHEPQIRIECAIEISAIHASEGTLVLHLGLDLLS